MSDPIEELRKWLKTDKVDAPIAAVIGALEAYDAKCAELEKVIAGSEVMEKALKSMYHPDAVQGIYEALAAWGKAKEALSTNAGAALIERLKEAEAGIKQRNWCLKMLVGIIERRTTMPGKFGWVIEAEKLYGPDPQPVEPNDAFLKGTKA